MTLGVKAAIVAAASSAALAVLPAAAPAAPTFDVDCFGKVSLGDSRADGTVAYNFACTPAFAGYEIITLNRQIAGFDTETLALNYTTGEPAPGEEYSCQGQIPTHAISCSGKASGGNRIGGTVNLLDDPCVGPRPEVGVIPVDKSGSPGLLFMLSNANPGHADRPLRGCPKVKAKAKPRPKSKGKRKITSRKG